MGNHHYLVEWGESYHNFSVFATEDAAIATARLNNGRVLDLRDAPVISGWTDPRCPSYEHGSAEIRCSRAQNHPGNHCWIQNEGAAPRAWPRGAQAYFVTPTVALLRLTFKEVDERESPF